VLVGTASEYVFEALRVTLATFDQVVLPARRTKTATVRPVKSLCTVPVTVRTWFLATDPADVAALMLDLRFDTVNLAVGETAASAVAVAGARSRYRWVPATVCCRYTVKEPLAVDSTDPTLFQVVEPERVCTCIDRPAIAGKANP
jgi:hypothetical protein